MRYYTVAILIVCTTIGSAQIDFSSAFVKEYNAFLEFDQNERVYGNVEIGRSWFFGPSKRILFTDKKGESYSIRSNDVVGFGLREYYFETKWIEDTPMFLRKMVSGPYALYRKMKRRNFNKLIDGEGLDVVGEVNAPTFLEKDFQIFFLSPPRFNSTYKKLFSDKEEVLQIIENEGLDYNDVEKIVKLCNSNDTPHVH